MITLGYAMLEVMLKIILGISISFITILLVLIITDIMFRDFELIKEIFQLVKRKIEKITNYKRFVIR